MFHSWEFASSPITRQTGANTIPILRLTNQDYVYEVVKQYIKEVKGK